MNELSELNRERMAMRECHDGAHHNELERRNRELKDENLELCAVSWKRRWEATIVVR